MITEKELFDYIKCPIKYDLVVNKGMIIESKTDFTLALEHVTKGFMLSIYNNDIAPMFRIKQRWDAACNKYYIDEKKNLEGMLLLQKMYQWAQKEQIIVDAIDQNYGIVINGIHGKSKVTGKVEYIVHPAKNKKHEILYLNFGNRIEEQVAYEMKLKYAMDVEGIKTLYNKQLGIRVHHVKYDKDNYALPVGDAVTRLKATVDAVSFGIENKIFYPRESYACTSCRIKNICRMWRG